MIEVDTQEQWEDITDKQRIVFLLDSNVNRAYAPREVGEYLGSTARRARSLLVELAESDRIRIIRARRTWWHFYREYEFFMTAKPQK